MRVSSVAICRDFGPEILTMPTPAFPEGVAMAAMVSVEGVILQKYRLVGFSNSSYKCFNDD